MRRALLFAATSTLLLGMASPLHAAAQASEDSRWLPWIGCWEPTDAPMDAEGAELLVCFEPTEDGVRVLTLGDGELLGEERIVADGRPIPAADGGCEGTREARWSGDRRRAFILSDLQCAEGVDRVTRGVFAMADEGREWLEIHGVRSADRDQTMAVRAFRTASPATLSRHERTAPGADRALAIRTSRLAASTALGAEELVEAVDVVGGEVTAALVAEMGEPYPLDARALRDYADAGVPSEVLDMMVAVTYPERFVIDAGEARPAPSQAGTAAQRPRYDPARAVRYGGAYSYGYGCRSWDRFCWDPFYRDMLWYYGSPGYGFAGGYGWGFRAPRYVIYTPGSVGSRGGTVSPGRGYRAPGASTRPAQPSRTQPSQGSPAQTGPAQTRPAQTRPAQPRPAQTRPTRTPPDPSPPASTRPSQTRSDPSPPAPVRPTQTRPTQTRPAQTRPAQTRPAQTRPTQTRPTPSPPAPARPARTGGGGG